MLIQPMDLNTPTGSEAEEQRVLEAEVRYGLGVAPF